ncbi:S8 family serine peptidase [Nocardia sp. NPDC050406]|uniref:S8 family serine peptidase n=1 Tax=Nocardia sp. NPDC050406 TaxID=3364318 RepID=UPI0037A95B49
MPDVAPRIIVKLDPGQVSVPYQDNAHLALGGFAQLAWNTLTASFPGVDLALNRLFSTQSEGQVRALLDAAATNSGLTPPDLLNVMAVDFPRGIDPEGLLGFVRALPFVEFAYVETPTELAAVDPSNDLLAAAQFHLLPAPFGVEAFFAWSLPGADGANVRIADIEYGWDLTHEDLVGGNIAQLNASVPGHALHSTACLGILVGQDNDRGIVGLAPQAKAAVVSALQPSLPDAFVLAVGFLQAGDVLLIEVQSAGGGPVEIDPHVTMLIHALTLLGIVVVEPAGNGRQDLDALLRADGTSLQRGAFNFVDSGAIMVGARQALVQDPMSFTSFGSRVDCHAAGENIVTTSVAPAQYMGILPGTGFGGTSGASAIIAGTAAITQGIARARGTTLTPTQLRTHLSNPTFNTPTNNPATDRIGVMPNLKEIAARI